MMREKSCFITDLFRAPVVDGPGTINAIAAAKRKIKNFEKNIPWVHRQHAKCTFCVHFEWTRSTDDTQNRTFCVVGGPVGGPNI